jgi:putative transcriptional regulator
MNDENMVRARRTPDGRWEQILPDGSTRPLERMSEADWARFDAMTDEEVYQNALDDPDNPPRTAAELARMPRVPNPKTLRLSLHLTQEEFARRFWINLGTLRDWEHGIRMPDGTAISYLRVIEKIPEAVMQALGTEARDTAAESSGERKTRSA